MKGLDTALDNVSLVYSDLSQVADSLVKPITLELDNLIKQAANNVNNLSLDDIRLLILQISLKSYTLGETKEKASLQSVCAEQLKDEAYAKKFNEIDGTVAFKQNKALLDSSFETLSEAVYNQVHTMLKLKLDECHRIVDALKSVLSSRMQEAKLAASTNESLGE